MILITGADGFIGSALSERLRGHYKLRLSVRDISSLDNSFSDSIIKVTLSPNEDWTNALSGVTTVIHCAARVHIMNDEAPELLSEFRRINVDGTIQLAKQAAQLGVKRFVFISSIKVNGESTQPGMPFHADQIPNPVDAYGISKLEAERALREIETCTGMEVVIVRPPLVYGRGVKANFANMIRWVKLGIPLPLGLVKNARSMVALDNLVDLLLICIEHPAAAGQTFLVSDGEDISTPDLIIRTARVMNKSIMLIPIPVAYIFIVAKMLGKASVAQRLCRSLQVDIAKTKSTLGWEPRLTLNQGLRKTIDWMYHETAL